LLLRFSLFYLTERTACDERSRIEDSENILNVSLRALWTPRRVEALAESDMRNLNQDGNL
jgi:hypothetical protein